MEVENQPSQKENDVTEKNEINELQNTRLMITHIDNVNFKSYAGKQTLGPFHKVSILFLCLLILFFHH